VVTVAGIVGALGRRFTKRGEPYAVFRLEDLTGGVGIVAFPSVFERAGAMLAPDRIVMVKGRADLRGRELQLVAIEVAEPDISSPAPEAEIGGDPRTGAISGGNGGSPGGGPGGSSDPLVVDVPASSCTGGLIGRLKELLALYPGRLPVVVRLVSEAEVTRLRLGDGYRVDGCAGLVSELARLLGPDAVRLAVEAVPAP
jgi:DNA polymerase-3 subunit alpha